jgi:hypothetical protein
MATYVSKPADYGNYTQPINLDLVNFVMQSKQQKYDYNLAKLESKITNELGAIDLVRTQDKEYFLERANSILGSAGDISQIDFSNNNNARALDNRINTIVDDRVLNDVISTSNYRAFQKTLQQKQADGEGYDPRNAAYSMEKYGANAWLKGESSSLGAINYNDYYDVQAEIEEMEENLERYIDVEKVTTPEGYYYVDREYERLSEDKIRKIVMSKLSDKAKKQIQINSWADVGGGDADYNRVTQQYKDYLGVNDANPNGTRIKQWDRTISELKLQLNKISDPTSEEAQTLKAEIKAAEETRERDLKSQNRFLNIDPNDKEAQTNAIDNMAYIMSMNRLVDEIADRNKINRMTDIKRTKNLQFEFDLAKYKQDLKNQAESMKNGGIGSGQPFSVRDEELSDVDSLQGLKDDLVSYSNSFSASVSQAMSAIDPEVRRNIENTYDPNSGISKEEHYYNMLKEQSTSTLSSNAIMALKQADEDKMIEDGLKRDYSDSIKYAFEKLESGLEVPGGIENFIDEIYSNTGVKMTDFNGNVVSAAEFLRANGITEDNAEDFNAPEFKEVKDHLLKNYYADMIITYEQPGVRRGIAEWFQERGIQSFGPSGDMEANDAIIAKMKSGEVGEANLYRERLEQIAGSPEAAQAIINTAKKNGTHGQRIYWMPKFRDTSFREDPTIGSLASLDNIEAKAREFLNDKYKAGRTIGVAFQTGSAEGLALLNELSNPNKNYGELAVVNPSKATSINIIPVGTDMVRINVAEDVKGEAVVREGLIAKNELPQIITDKVELGLKQRYNAYSPETLDTFSGVANYSDESNVRHVKNVAGLITGDVESALLVTKDESLNKLAASYINVLGSDSQPTPLRVGIDRAMEDGVLEYKLLKEDGEFYRQLGMNINNEFVPLYSENRFASVPPEFLEREYNIATYAPQIGVYAMLQNVLREFSLDPENPRMAIKKLIEYGVK